MTAAVLGAKQIATSLLMLATLAGTTMVAADPVQAAESPRVGVVVFASLDVGGPTEGDANAGTPAVSPDGTLVWAAQATSPHVQPLQAATAQGWIAVIATASGARIRSRPVDGPVLGTIGYGAGFWVSCTRGASDGHAWGWSYRGGTYGWVRGDLWEVEQHTGPGGAGTPRVPRCP